MNNLNKITKLIQENNKRLGDLKKMQKQTYNKYHQSIKQIMKSKISDKEKQQKFIKLVVMYEKQMSKIQNLVKKYELM